jgi:hypothetical protein
MVGKNIIGVVRHMGLICGPRGILVGYGKKYLKLYLLT